MRSDRRRREMFPECFQNSLTHTCTYTEIWISVTNRIPFNHLVKY